jgi:hypothetical protein
MYPVHPSIVAPARSRPTGLDLPAVDAAGAADATVLAEPRAKFTQNERRRSAEVPKTVGDGATPTRADGPVPADHRSKGEDANGRIPIQDIIASLEADAELEKVGD